MKVSRKVYVEALNRVASTEDGQILLSALKDACRWDTTYIASDNPVATHFYAAKRGVYGSLRKDIASKHLKVIEYDYQVVSDFDEKEETK